MTDPVQGVDAIPAAPISGIVLSASREPASGATIFARQNVIRPEIEIQIAAYILSERRPQNDGSR